MNDVFDELKSLRLAVYALLIASTVSVTTARILYVQSGDGQTPFLSANDRSRWSTISALVDEGAYEIDSVRVRPGWKSIDMVRHEGRDGEPYYYSSKPPLFPTMLAIQYGLLKTATGASLEENTFYVARFMLVLTNVVPLLVYLLLIASWVEEYGDSNWGRIFVVACASWGTYLTTFAITLNNHLPAAVCVMVCTYCLFRIWRDDDAHPMLFVISGLSAAFTAANELPALSFLAIVSLALLNVSSRKTLTAFVPAVMVVVIAFFLTNFIAHESLRPPYAHREQGDNWYDYPGSYWTSNARSEVDQGEEFKGTYAFHVLIGHHGIFSLSPIWILSVAGIFVSLTRREGFERMTAIGTALLMVVCLTFYIALRPENDRNYGGTVSGFRWMFWFIPLWLMTMMPVADWLSETRFRRAVGVTLFGISVLSANYSAMNPWSHPWIYRYWQSLGWV